MNISLATPADIPSMMALERASGSAAHWTEQQYHNLLAADSRHVVLVAQAHQQMLGFLVAQQVPPEWELENIVVSGDCRRRGVGTELMKNLIRRARETESDSVFLEVRESNQAARKFYEQAGFRQTGRRNAYYSDPAEDAILYHFSLK